MDISKTKSKRIIRSSCPVSCTLDILGDKWTLLIVRDIALMRKRYYQDFLFSPEKIATNILADRLKKLKVRGILQKRYDANQTHRPVYTLTEKGLDLVPVVLGMLRWGAKHELAVDKYDYLIHLFEANPEDYIKTIRLSQKENLTD